MRNYYRDEPNSGAEGNTNYSIKDSKSFDYKTSIIGRLEGSNTEKEVKIVMPIKDLSNFWKTLDMSLINCEVSLILTWFENCKATSKAAKYADPDANPEVVAVNNPTNATFEITDTSLYVPVVALSTEDHNKLLDYLKRGFKKTIKWNKYRSEMSKQAKTNILNYLIDPTFNRLFN